MKKWSFLVASLLMMGVTATTFTSCVDTDEPEGILNMRNAKAEYIRALAAVENAKIAYQQALASSANADAELAKAQAEAAKIQAQIAAEQAKIQNECNLKIAEAQAQAALIKAEGEKNLNDAKAQVALAEAEKILAEAMDEKARTEQLIAENQIKLEEMKAKLEVVLKDQETKMLYAESNYQQALKDIAALELVLSTNQSAVLNAAKSAYTSAYKTLNTAKNNLVQAQKELIVAIYGQEDGIQELKDDVATKTETLNKLNAAYASLKDLLASTEVTEWENKIAEMEKLVGKNAATTHPTTGKTVGDGSAAQEYSELELQKQEILQNATTEKEALKNDLQAYINAQQYYNYLANPAGTATDPKLTDCFGGDAILGAASPKAATGKDYGKMGNATTHGAAEFEQLTSAKADYTFNEIKIELVNPELIDLFKTDPKFTTENGKSYLKIAKAENKKYDEIATAFASKLTDDKFTFSNTLRTWEKKAADYKVTAEDIAADTCKAKSTVADKETALANAVDMFKKMHQQYETGEIVDVVKTDKVIAAINKYNEQFAKLDQAVKDANKTYDDQKAAVAKALTDGIQAYYDSVYNDKKATAQLAEFKTLAGNSKYTLGGAVVYDFTGVVSIAKAEEVIKSKDEAIVAKKDAKLKDAAAIIAAIKAESDYKYAYNPSEKDKDDLMADAKKAVEITDTHPKTESVLYQKALDTQKAENKKAADAINDKITKKDEGLNDLKAAIVKAIKSGDATKPGYLEEAAVYAQVPANKLALDINVLIGFEKIDGTSTKANQYNTVGAKEGNGKDITDYVVDAVKLNDKGDAYVAVEGHKTLTVAAIDVKDALKLKVDDSKVGAKTAIELAWEGASEKAFGVVRHTELKEDMLQSVDAKPASVTAKDEKGNAIDATKLAASALGQLLMAKAADQKHADLAASTKAAEDLVKEIQKAEETLKAAIAVYAADVEAAKKAANDAKDAHLKSYNAYVALTSDINAKQDELVAKVAGVAAVKNAAQAVVDNFYKSISLTYIDKDGKKQTLTWTDLPTGKKNFAGVTAWVEAEMANFEAEKNIAPNDKSIKEAEKNLAKAQKELDRVNENLIGADKKGTGTAATIAHDYILSEKENMVAYRQALLEYYTTELEAAQANLNKVIEAVGNGVAITIPGYTPETPNGTTIGGASSDPALNDNVTIVL